jgi:hypothetical protein
MTEEKEPIVDKSQITSNKSAPSADYLNKTIDVLNGANVADLKLSMSASLISPRTAFMSAGAYIIDKRFDDIWTQYEPYAMVVGNIYPAPSGVLDNPIVNFHHGLSRYGCFSAHRNSVIQEHTASDFYDSVENRLYKRNQYFSRTYGASVTSIPYPETERADFVKANEFMGGDLTDQYASLEYNYLRDIWGGEYYEGSFTYEETPLYRDTAWWGANSISGICPFMGHDLLPSIDMSLGINGGTPFEINALKNMPDGMKINEMIITAYSSGMKQTTYDVDIDATRENAVLYKNNITYIPNGFCLFGVYSNGVVGGGINVAPLASLEVLSAKEDKETHITNYVFRAKGLSDALFEYRKQKESVFLGLVIFPTATEKVQIDYKNSKGFQSLLMMYKPKVDIAEAELNWISNGYWFGEPGYRKRRVLPDGTIEWSFSFSHYNIYPLIYRLKTTNVTCEWDNLVLMNAVGSFTYPKSVFFEAGLQDSVEIGKEHRVNTVVEQPCFPSLHPILPPEEPNPDSPIVEET